MDFCTDLAFCSACGALLPNLPDVGNFVNCMSCKFATPLTSFEGKETAYTVLFNKKEKHKAKKSNEEDGPVIDRFCPKCGHDKMSYAALQLRSADEGQTVFFTCLKCKYKESENS